MEYQVIYFAKMDTSKKSRGWTYVALPVPATAAEAIQPNILNMLDCWLHMDFLAFVSKLFAEDGEMKGW